MSRVSPYNSVRERQLTAALTHLLATEYGFLGGGRVLGMLTSDINALIEQFYPPRERLEHGHIVWNCAANEGKKAEPGKKTAEYRTISLILPLIVRDDIDKRVETAATPAAGRKKQTEQLMVRMARVVQSAAEQQGLLTIADLSLMFSLPYERTRKLLRQWEEENGQLLPMKGMMMDQGSRPTHKREIIAFYERGMAEPDIARATNHSLKSVERYISDYKRVLLLLEQPITAEQISAMVGRGLFVVEQYIEIAQIYHPHLFQDGDTGKIAENKQKTGE